GSEGDSLRNTMQVHIMEPYWHEVSVVQMIGRTIRLCSHKDLPMSERHVDFFRYKSVKANRSKMTTDKYIEYLDINNDYISQSFLYTVKEEAVDCQLNKNHNILVDESLKCFQFDESSLFDEQIGPAYKEDIFDDMKIDNGSNSTK